MRRIDTVRTIAFKWKSDVSVTLVIYVLQHYRRAALYNVNGWIRRSETAAPALLSVIHSP
jgi:hypothetical protein